MKKTMLIAALVALTGCAEMKEEAPARETGEMEMGLMSVKVKFDDVLTRTVTDYRTALEQEKAVKKVDILVFDYTSKALNAVKRVTALDGECQMSIPVGKKLVYAIVNGPDPDGVTTVSDMGGLVDRLSADMTQTGLTLTGSAEYEVKAGTQEEPAVITVGWLVSRVVLTKVHCNIPQQYGEMYIDCVYLGNANTTQTFAGSSSDKANVDGLSKNGAQIGKNGESGDYSSYLFRSVGRSVQVNEALTDKYHMYCQPNTGPGHTCMYILATIGENKYYYRVPLAEGLKPNTTCSVELKITNLGASEPPVDDLQKGQIEAEIDFQDWIAGTNYVEEF